MLKRSNFIAIFIGTHLVLLFLYIYQYSRYIKLTYTIQENEQTKLELMHKKQELVNQLYIAQDHGKVKQFALKNLKLEPIKLHQIKRLKIDECSKNL